jgi:hypothetical protein
VDTHVDAVAASDGAGATDRIVLTHVNGSLAMPRVYFTESSDRGATWASPRAIETAGDRGFYTAPRSRRDGRPRDPRGSRANALTDEFLGDYVYAVAARDYGAAVWSDTRNAADCPAIDAWRMSLQTGSALPTPAPQQDCPATFGNSDIFGGSYVDPNAVGLQSSHQQSDVAGAERRAAVRSRHEGRSCRGRCRCG